MEMIMADTLYAIRSTHQYPGCSPAVIYMAPQGYWVDWNMAKRELRVQPYDAAKAVVDSYVAQGFLGQYEKVELVPVRKVRNRYVLGE
jgi:hypothetical protein